uniref:HTH CENPB-type domain-containing protein n=1 Tax=Sinocyclocheilus grahami TaxID=75366 RepID=A0A672LD51_SINGR
METKRKKYDLTFKLTVVKFAEQNSGEAAARHFSVDPKRVREWRKNKAELQRLSEEDDKRARLRGGGRKKASEELEVSVCEWIHSMRAKHLRVSRKMIRAKAKEVYATVSDGRDEESFTASAGWLDKFLRRNDFSVRRRTTVAQKDAKHFTEKLRNPCASGRELLVQARQAELAEAGEGEVEESDVEEEFANELVIEDRGDDDSDE